LKTILTENQIQLTIQRLACQIREDYPTMQNTVLIGLQPRGVFFSNKIALALQKLLPNHPFHYGKLDITFYRDDIRKALHLANKTDLLFSIENKNVILIDDVLYTGRTIRAALDALVDFGRPAKVALCVLIDRRFSREFPIQPDYVGRAIDTIVSQKVKVHWLEVDHQEYVELLDS
jgi:pyrimidine operon attenuation protein/uracil phosphoribosyltransferase